MTEDSLTAAAADLGHELVAITEIEVLPADYPMVWALALNSVAEAARRVARVAYAESADLNGTEDLSDTEIVAVEQLVAAKLDWHLGSSLDIIAIDWGMPEVSVAEDDSSTADGVDDEFYPVHNSFYPVHNSRARFAVFADLAELTADELCEMLRDVADGIEQAVESDESSS